MSKLFYRLAGSNYINSEGIVKSLGVGDSFHVVDFEDLDIPLEITTSDRFYRYGNMVGGRYYLKVDDSVYKSVLDSKLARILYPDAIVHKGYLLIKIQGKDDN